MGSQSTHQLLHPTKHHNQINQLFPEKTKMKVSQVAAVLAVTASASAAPWKDGKKSWGGHWKGGWKNGHEEKCMDGPFEFTVKQIEDNPSAFFTDVHSSLAVPGAVRGQL